MKVRPSISFSAMCVLTLMVFLWWAFPETRFGSGSRLYSGAGGKSEYVRQRVEHLKRLRNNIHVTDPAVRVREIAEIDRQLAEIGHEAPEEIGEERKVERFEKRAYPPDVYVPTEFRNAPETQQAKH